MTKAVKLTDNSNAINSSFLPPKNDEIYFKCVLTIFCVSTQNPNGKFVCPRKQLTAEIVLDSIGHTVGKCVVDTFIRMYSTQNAIAYVCMTKCHYCGADTCCMYIAVCICSSKSNIRKHTMHKKCVFPRTV